MQNKIHYSTQELILLGEKLKKLVPVLKQCCIDEDDFSKYIKGDRLDFKPKKSGTGTFQSLMITQDGTDIICIGKPNPNKINELELDDDGNVMRVTISRGTNLYLSRYTQYSWMSKKSVTNKLPTINGEFIDSFEEYVFQQSTVNEFYNIYHFVLMLQMTFGSNLYVDVDRMIRGDVEIVI